MAASLPYLSIFNRTSISVTFGKSHQSLTFKRHIFKLLSREKNCSKRVILRRFVVVKGTIDLVKNNS